MAAPVVTPLAPANVPANKSLIVPVTGFDADGQPLTYSVSSTNGQAVTASLHQGNPYLKLSVQGYGDMTFQLFHDLAPKTVDTIRSLVEQGFYNGLKIHRTVPDFVIQGGDPNGNGSGGPGFTFGDEFNPEAIFSGNGQLAMANSGKDTNGSQFFVTVGPQRFLDFNHTIFGQLVRGFDVLDTIDHVPNSGPPNNTPTSTILITSATIIDDTTDAVLTLDAKAATGSATITVTATDPDGNSTSRNFVATIVNDSTDDPPILGPVSNQIAATGRPFDIVLSGIDLENDPMSFDAAVLDTVAHATVSTSGNTVTVTPEAGYKGDVHLIVGVRQTGATSRGSASNEFDTEKITVTFKDPTITAQGGTAFDTSARTVAKNVTLATFDVSVPRPLSNYKATIQWGDGFTSFGTITPRTGGGYNVIGSHIYASAGMYPVSVTIQDTFHNLNKVASTTANVATNPMVVHPTLDDFDGDGKTDLGVYQPGASFYTLQTSSSGNRKVTFGQGRLYGGDPIPVTGDFDGDGQTDYGVYQPSDSKFTLQTSSSGNWLRQFGQGRLYGGDPIPVTGDFNGDGRSDVGVFQPGDSYFTLMTDTGNLLFQFGQGTKVRRQSDPDHRGFRRRRDYRCRRLSAGRLDVHAAHVVDGEHETHLRPGAALRRCPDPGDGGLRRRRQDGCRRVPAGGLLLHAAYVWPDG